MTAKKIVTAALLLFVATSIGFLVFRQADGGGAATGSPAVTAAGTSTATAVSPGAAGPAAGVDDSRAVGRRLVAIYFHGNKRCNTCRAIEAQSKEALEAGFPEALMAGLLEWREVNLDQPGNDHFAIDYGLTGSSLVLVDIRNGTQARFKNLRKVWDLAADRPAFLAYVQGEARSWLEAP